MEVGGLGSTLDPAAKLAVEANSMCVAIATTPVQLTEVPLALDLQETQDPATHTPAQRQRYVGGTTSGRHAGGEEA